MADTTLVEPGLEGLHMALIYEGAGNRLVFPHVDSCVALIVLCDKGEMVGAHVARTEKGQELAAKHHYRPRSEAVAQKYAADFPKLNLFTIDEVFGGWQKAQKTHFNDGGIYDQIQLSRR